MVFEFDYISAVLNYLINLEDIFQIQARFAVQKTAAVKFVLFFLLNFRRVISYKTDHINLMKYFDDIKGEISWNKHIVKRNDFCHDFHF